jgi:ABC-2 type transport system ATP-binding protein
MSYALEISNLNKTYYKQNKSFCALTDINLNIKQSSIFGLLGPNGAGKSTLINIISGLVKKTSGSVKIFGIDLDSDPQSFKRLVGVVPQEIVLDTFFNLRDYLELFAGYYGIPKKDRRSDEILEALDLTSKAHLTQRELSGGMKRRFLIAKSLVHSPKLLILDEPTAGVDIDLRNQLWSYVKKLNQEGICIILTTHYLLEAENLCDDIGFINRGKIIKIDKKDNLLKNIESKTIELICGDIVENFDQISKLENIELIDKNKILIHIKANQSLNDKLQKLMELGVFITDMRTKNSDLESVFTNIMINS